MNNPSFTIFDDFANRIEGSTELFFDDLSESTVLVRRESVDASRVPLKDITNTVMNRRNQRSNTRTVDETYQIFRL